MQNPYDYMRTHRPSPEVLRQCEAMNTESGERITKAVVRDVVESVREVVDVLDAIHEQKTTLPAAELRLFVALKNALATYDGAQAAHD